MQFNQTNVGALPLKERSSFSYIDKGEVCVIDSSFVVKDENGVRMTMPIGSIGCLMLGPGTSITHEAIKTAGNTGTTIHFVGEHGVRFYSSIIPPNSSSRNLLWQARLVLDEQARKKVAQAMFRFRFMGDNNDEDDNAFIRRATIDQLRGYEGDRIRKLYKQLASAFGIQWRGRKYDKKDFNASDLPNKCLNVANRCMYGLSESAILLSGFSPAFGFIHCGTQKSFVYDIADMYKFTVSIQAAFTIAAKGYVENPEQETRRLCRDIFVRQGILKKIIPSIQDVLKAGDLPAPEFPADAIILEPEMLSFDEEELVPCP